MFNKELLMMGSGDTIPIEVKRSRFVISDFGASYKTVDFYSPLGNHINLRVGCEKIELVFTLGPSSSPFDFSKFVGATYMRVGGDATLIIKAVKHNQGTLYAPYTFGLKPSGEYTFLGIDVFDEI